MLLGSCAGAIDGSDDGTPGTAGIPGTPGGMTTPMSMATPSAPVSREVPGADLAPASGLRRLTVDEYDNTIRDLLGDGSRPGSKVLNDDARTPFDNDYTSQASSFSLIQAAERLAREASQRLLADAARRDKTVGCVPASMDDQDCPRGFITRFGRLALRRPLADEDVARYLQLHRGVVQATGNFYAGIDALVRAFLLDPEFLYRVEIGTPVPGTPGVFRLDGFELATRLAYFIWGAPPTAALLDRAQAGQLATPDQVRAAAADMLKNARAKDRLTRFHAMWLGYEALPVDANMARAMRGETNALLSRVIFDERRPWLDLFTSTESFVTDTLAKQYGLPAPANPNGAWVPYGTSGRRGLLSQGSFLTIGAKFDDTSPTVRGKFVRERIFCQPVPDPPPNAGVNVDVPPPATSASACKFDRYTAHRQGGCAGCHGLMDPIGFGLENYDATGRFRKYDRDANGKDIAACPIRGEGDVDGAKFSGPSGLADLVVHRPGTTACIVTQLYRFAIGRGDLDGTDAQVTARIAARVSGPDFRLDDVITDLVSSTAFAHRREEM
jgi:hypothetical protein